MQRHLLSLLVLSVAAVAFGEPGLAIYRFKDNGRFGTPVSQGTVTNFTRLLPRTSPDVMLRGVLDVPADGTYVFASRNREMIRIDGIGYELTEGTRFTPARVTLKKGRHVFQRWIANRFGFREGDSRLSWALPGTTNLVWIPETAFSHTAADLGQKAFVVSEPAVERTADASSFVNYRFRIAKSGFYRLSIRRAGVFRWGNLTPSDMVGVWIDGVHRRQFYGVNEFGGFFDDEGIVQWYEKGDHRFELRGTSASHFLKDEPRVWLTPLDGVREAEKTFSVAEDLPGESVFRKGESVAWTLSRSTLDRTEPLTVSVVVRRQRRDAVVWRGDAELKPGAARASARVAFPKDLDGAFEYEIVAGGKTLEGPWEFLVVDTARKPAPPRGAAMDKLADFARQVDAVDFAAEEIGKGPHRVRDNGTSRLVRTGALAYRVSGPKRRGVDRSLGYPPGGPHYANCDWFAATLHLKHPRVAHVARVFLPNDVFRRFPVQLKDTVTGHSNGAAYEILPADKPGSVEMLIPFWPNATSIDVLMVPSDTHNDPRATPAACAKIELYECPDGFPAMPEAACGWNPKRLTGWDGEQGDLSPERSSTPPLWDDAHMTPAMLARRHARDYFYDYTAYALAWERFGEYSAWQGNNFLQWPVHSYGIAHVQTERLPWGNSLFASGEGFRPIDKFRRNSLKIILLACEKYGIGFWGDIQLNHNVGRDLAAGLTFDEIFAGGRFGPDGKPVKPAVSTELFKTVVSTENVTDFSRLDGCFLVEDNRLGGNFNPAHPVGRAFLRHFYGDIARFCKDLPAFRGMNIRQWNSCSSTVSCWWSSSLSGYDDWTLGTFARETGVRCPASAKTVSERQAYFHTNEAARTAWFRWRADKVTSLRQEVLDEMRKYRPDATLRQSLQEGYAPVVEQGMGLDRTKLTRDMGFNLAQASIRRQGNEMCALDPVAFDGFDIRPEVAHTNTPMEIVTNGTRYLQGLCTAAAMFAPPHTTRGFAEAMARETIDIAYYGQYWSYPAGNVLLRDWLRAFRAVPDLAFETLPDVSPDPEIVCRRAGTVAYFVSLRPYPMTVVLPTEAEDMVRGGKVRELRLAPYGLELVRSTAPIHSFLRKSESPEKGVLSRLFGASAARPDPTADAHLDLTVGNPSGAARTGALCIIRGGDLIARGVTTSVLKLFRGNEEIPLQLDRRDARGWYGPSVPGPLNPTDEVCFLCDFAAGETRASFVLAAGGRPAKAFPTPFAVAPYRSDDRRARTNYTLKVTSGPLEVGFLGRGIGLLKYDGKWAYTGSRGGGNTGWTILGGEFGSDAKDRPIQPDGETRVLSSGPVRLLAGYGFGAPTTRYRHPPRHPFAYPAFDDFTVARIWQFRAGVPTVDIANRYHYGEVYQNVLSYVQFWEGSFPNRDTPNDTKRIYCAAPDGTLEVHPWRTGKKDGEFGVAHSGTWFGFWDTARDCGYGVAIDPVYSALGGITFNTALCYNMANQHVSTQRHDFEFRLALGAFGNDPAAKGVADWAREAMAEPPVVTIGARR